MTAIDGRVVLITGGAAGIGREMAAAFGARGGRLVLFDRDREALARTAESLRGKNVPVHTEACDVAVPDSLENALAGGCLLNLPGAQGLGQLRCIAGRRTTAQMVIECLFNGHIVTCRADVRDEVAHRQARDQHEPRDNRGRRQIG